MWWTICWDDLDFLSVVRRADVDVRRALASTELYRTDYCKVLLVAIRTAYRILCVIKYPRILNM